MNTLFRSTGTRPAAKRISTGMVVVKPTRCEGSIPDEDEVDEDDGDHDRPSDEQHHVPVDDDLGRPPSARVPEDDHRRADREQEDEHVFPAEQDRQDEDDRGAEKDTGVGGHFRNALAGEKIENLIHGVPLSDDARLTWTRWRFTVQRAKVAGAGLENPVGVFDSGVGGLTVLRELVSALPSERFVYLGDTARVPYGGKSAETVTRYAIEIANHLIRTRDIKLLVVACNTASSLALPVLRKIYKIPVVGMVDPCVRRAAALSEKRSIGVIGTLGTVRSGAYEEALRLSVPSATVRSIPCPLLVSLAEEGWTDNAITRAVIAEYLAPFLEDPPDALILGCTHYPVLKGPIREYLGGGTVLIDSAEEAARVVDILLSETQVRRDGTPGAVEFLVTDDPERFARVGKGFFGRALPDVGRVAL